MLAERLARTLLGICSEFARNLLGICSDFARNVLVRLDERSTEASRRLLYLVYRHHDEQAFFEGLVHGDEAVILDIAMVVSVARMEAVAAVGVGDPSPHKGLARSSALEMLEIEVVRFGLGATYATNG